MKFQLYPIYAAKQAKIVNLTAKQNHIWISIFDHRNEQCSVYRNDFCIDQARIDCQDSIRQGGFPGSRTFTEEQAYKVVKFVERCKNTVDLILICCPSGLSLAPSIGIPLSMHFNKMDTITGQEMHLESGPDGLIKYIPKLTPSKYIMDIMTKSIESYRTF